MNAPSGFVLFSSLGCYIHYNFNLKQGINEPPSRHYHAKLAVCCFVCSHVVPPHPRGRIVGRIGAGELPGLEFELASGGEPAGQGFLGGLDERRTFFFLRVYLPAENQLKASLKHVVEYEA